MEEYMTQSLPPADETIISRYSDVISEKTRILLSFSDSDIGKRMSAFCDRLHELVPAVSVVREPSDEDVPTIHISNNIHFQAVPSGKLLETFLLALLGNDTLAGQDTGLDPDDIRQRITLPAMLKMYVSANCPYCHLALPRGLFLAGVTPSRIDLRVIDAELFPETARSDRVRSVPMTILDDRFRWTGVFALSEVIDMIADRNPTQLSADTLKKMISDGNAEGVARLMDESRLVIPGFIDLITHDKWAVRLGAMVAFEYLAELNTAVSRKILEDSWDRFSGAGDAAKGDILHLFGILGDKALISLLETVTSGPYSESIKGVALEVIDTING